MSNLEHNDSKFNNYKVVEPLSKEMEVELLKKAKCGNDDAKMKLVGSVLKLIRRSVLRWNSLPKDTYKELEQAGVMGTLRAIEKYDFSYNNGFSTYAEYWWNQGINREAFVFLYRGRSSKHGMVAKYYSKLKKSLEKNKGDCEAVAKELHLDLDTITGFKSLIVGMESLDECVLDKKNLYEMIGVHDDDKSDIIDKKGMLDMIRSELNKMSARRRDIIIWRFEYGETLEHVANNYGVSRESIRQNQERAINELRDRLRIAVIKKRRRAMRKGAHEGDIDIL